MPYRLTVPLAIELAFETTVPLAEIEGHRTTLQRSGVYLIHEQPQDNEEFNPYLPTILYIGKAIGETIYSRSRKHRQAFSEYGMSKADAKMRPCKRFQEYRASIAGQPGELLLSAAFMDKDKPYLISCAEEYLIHSYFQQHGNRPRANTK